MTNIKPLGKRVLVKRAKAAEKKGSILLPDSAKEKPREGSVVAVGPGEYNDQGKLIPVELKVGDRVMFGSYAGTEVKQESQEEEYLILSESDILGVLVS